MIRPLIACVALAFLSACSMFQPKERAWSLACKHSEYSCLGVKEPKTVEVDLVKGILGEYFPEDDYVALTVGLKEPERTIVLAHEMTHYLQWVHGKSKKEDPHWIRCQREHEAFDVSYAVSLELNQPDTQWSEIAIVYGCMPF